jgi:hypothetical protein
MRTAVTGIGVVVVLLLAAWMNPFRAPAMAQTASSVGAGQLIAFTADAGPGAQQITLIDPRTRVMSVYHIDRGTGGITLRSVRNVQWDLQLDEFNGNSPSPREIQSLLQQR